MQRLTPFRAFQPNWVFNVTKLNEAEFSFQGGKQTPVPPIPQYP